MIKKIARLMWFWAPVVLWMGLIFYASSLSGEEMPKFEIPYIDKLFHFVEYLILGFLLARASFHSSSVPRYKYIFLAAVAVAALYGASDEFHQRFVSGRSCDIFDLFSDVIGSAVGAGLSLYKERIKSAVDKTV